MTNGRWTRRRVLWAIAFGAAGVAAGCGGGSGSGRGRGATRKRVSDLHEKLTGVARMLGTVSPSLDTSIGGGGAGGGGGAMEGAGPMLAAFLSQIASNGAPRRSVRLKAIRRTRQEMPPDGGGGSDPGEDPPPFAGSWFYFDFFLNLWVQVSDTEGRSRYDLYEDEAKTKPAGFIETIWPTSWDVFPQVWVSSYAFTAGTVAGASGSWESTIREDFSGSSKGVNTYPDGSRDTSQSNWTGSGDTSWQSRSEGASGTWSETSGTFRSDGSGGLRWEDSQGFAAIYQYNRDGSGRATFSGPDPNLPVTVVWDAFGNATITYADGSSERIDGWWGHWWGPMPGGGGGGTIGTP